MLPPASFKLPEIAEVATARSEQVPALRVQLAPRQAALAAPRGSPASGALRTVKQLAAEPSHSLDAVYAMARTGRIPVAPARGMPCASTWAPEAPGGAGPTLGSSCGLSEIPRRRGRYWLILFANNLAVDTAVDRCYDQKSRGRHSGRRTQGEEHGYSA